VRQCHQSDNGEHSDIKALYDFIAARWEEADDPPSDLRSRTYLKREGMYFGMLLSTLDAVAIYSLPDDSG